MSENHPNIQERNAMATKVEVVIYMTGRRYDEGLRLTPYRVSNSPWAIEYGHKLTPDELRRVKHLTPDLLLKVT